MFRLTAPTMLLLVGGCATKSLPVAAAPEMVVDFESSRVATPNWQAAFNDCSDGILLCIEVPDRFIMAFPTLCPVAVADWRAAGHRFRMTAPTPHYGAPSGGYISDKYPHIHLSWLIGSGFQTWSKTVKTPYEQGWDPNETVEVYRVRFVGGPAFTCTSPE